MSCGKTHTKFTYFTTGLTYFTTMFLGFREILPYSPEFLSLGVILGLWFNPDLDIPYSDPSRRWGRLRWIWDPYRRQFEHRGNFFRRNFWTHFPVIGFFLRAWPIYLLIPFLPSIPIYCVIVISMGIIINDVIHLACDVSQSYGGWPK